MNIIDIPKRSDLIATLTAAGVKGQAAMYLAGATASNRHARRVEAVKEAALYAGDDSTAHAMFLCFLDSYNKDYRIQAFQHLGSGRRTGPDGEAWTAAIREAGWELASRYAGVEEGVAAVLRLEISPHPEGIEWALWREDGERAGGCGSGVVTPHFDGVVVPLYSVARDGLRASVGLAPICAPPGPVSLYEAKPEAWAESFNFISAYWRRESVRLRLPPLTFMS